METVASEETDLGYTCRLSGSSPSRAKRLLWENLFSSQSTLSCDEPLYLEHSTSFTISRLITLSILQ